jgi:hypothetical protein
LYYDNYLYTFINNTIIHGWVRQPVDTAWSGTAILPDSETIATDYFKYLDNTTDIYWTVRVSVIDGDVCPNIIPFIETEKGIRLINEPNNPICDQNHVWDEFTVDMINLPSISVTPEDQSFPDQETFDDGSIYFTVTNTGGGIISGTATITGGSPFMITDGVYVLDEGETKDIYVEVTSPVTGTFVDTIIFTGGNGHTANIDKDIISFSGDNRIFENGDNATSENSVDNRIVSI